MRRGLTDTKNVEDWAVQLRRIWRLDQLLRIRKREVSIQEILAEPWAAECSRRTWVRSLAILASIGAPLEYRQSEHDSHYRYTDRRWIFWRAVEAHLNR